LIIKIWLLTGGKSSLREKSFGADLVLTGDFAGGNSTTLVCEGPATALTCYMRAKMSVLKEKELLVAYIPRWTFSRYA